MSKRKVEFKRITKETEIFMQWDPDASGDIRINTSIPFLDHMFTAMAFHGRFNLLIEGKGDIEVDYHHLTEDLGLVLGELLAKVLAENVAVTRFAHCVLPMDESLAEVVIDVCGRPTLVYKLELPQPQAGDFDLALMREFFIALANRAKISLHILGRYGENSHHLLEAAFKALGKAIKQAYSPVEGGEVVSTKGTLV